jgi:hypothetical protein
MAKPFTCADLAGMIGLPFRDHDPEHQHPADPGGRCDCFDASPETYRENGETFYYEDSTWPCADLRRIYSPRYDLRVKVCCRCFVEFWDAIDGDVDEHAARLALFDALAEALEIPLVPVGCVAEPQVAEARV